jgi:Protein of unknown function (DUF3592)
MRFVFYRLLTYRQGAWVCGGAGLAILAVAFYMARGVSVELRTWPRVEAHVDTADVATVSGPKGTTVYAARLRLSYRYQGQNYRTSATLRQEWPDYGTAASEAARVSQGGQALVMLDPNRPTSALPREGAASGPFIIAAIFGVIGLAFVSFGIGAWRTGLREGLDRIAGSGLATAPRFASALFAGMGALFIIGAVVGAVVGPQGKYWTPVQGRIDGSDVVEKSPGMFAVRTWYTYAVSGQTYRGPVTANTSRAYAAARRLASEVEQGGANALLVDPSNPNRVALATASRLQGIVMPTAFGLFGALFVAIGVLIRRRETSPDALRGRAA